MTQKIPLNKLVLSNRNVRKTDGDSYVESLADSIHRRGLLQNLVVSEGANGRKYEVDAGGRRWRALKLNVKKKRISAAHPVPCIVVPRDEARDASLAENLDKVAMNPADEVEAFAAIVEQDDTQPGAIANCARRFGRTERYVRQRLALATLAPEILEALRAGRITIEAARAYAAHPAPDVQLMVFRKQESVTHDDWKHRPSDIRDQLAGKVYPVDHYLVRYAGLDAYREAGGRIGTDLFFGEGEREQLLDQENLRS